MLLIPTRRRDGRLYLDAFSYSDAELDSVATLLRRYAIPFQVNQIPPDNVNRDGRRYIIPSQNVADLEQQLSVSFMGEEAQTRVQVQPGGTGHKCEQLIAGGTGSGCVNFAATNQVDATVKCALIANSQGWLGGVPSPGTCRGSGSKFSGLFRRGR